MPDSASKKVLTAVVSFNYDTNSIDVNIDYSEESDNVERAGAAILLLNDLLVSIGCEPLDPRFEAIIIKQSET